MCDDHEPNVVSAVCAALLGLRKRLRRLRMVERGETCPRLGGGTDVDLVLRGKTGEANRILQNLYLPPIQEGMIEKCLEISA